MSDGKRLIITPQEFAYQVAQMRAASRSRVRDLKALYESNAEVQRWRTLTPEERHREAIERMTKLRRLHNDMKQGKDTTETEARRQAIALANRFDREVKK